MTDAVLVVRGHVEQVWRGCRARDIDLSRLTGQMLEVEGDVAPGMSYRDGRFYSAPPRPSADAIRAEAERRTETVFPPALQQQLAALGGEFTAVMFGYVLGVHRQAAAFLAVDAAPADFCDDHHWPAVPNLALAPVPMVRPEPVTVLQQAGTAPVNVTITLPALDLTGRTLEAPARLVREAATPADLVSHETIPPVRLGELDDLRSSFVLLARHTYDAALTPGDQERIAALAAHVTGSSTRAEIETAMIEVTRMMGAR